MTMKNIIADINELAEQYGLYVCCIRGSEVVQIRKNSGDRYEDIRWGSSRPRSRRRDWPYTMRKRAISSR